eukprot:6752671-Pyramimonas_sp.AAC.1
MRWLHHEATADVVFLQEVAVAPGAKAEAEQACRKEGWKVAFNASVVTDKGGLSSGVGIGVRAHIGMSDPPAGPVLPKDRVIARGVNCAVRGGFLAVSVYLVTGRGLDGESKL